MSAQTPPQTTPNPTAAGAATKRYVVGYDGTAPSQSALTMATAMARAFRAELEIVLVLREDDPYQQVYPPVGNISPMVQAQARTWLQEAADLVAAQTPEGQQPVAARTHLWRASSVVTGLLEAVEQLDAAMIAISAGSGRGRLSVGPVADAVLHACPVPVALAPRRYREQAVPDHLYAAVGTRPGAHQVIREALEVAERTGLPLSVVTFLIDDDAAGDSGVVNTVRARVQATVEKVAGQVAQVPIQVAAAKSLKKAVRAVDWQDGGVLLIGSSRLAQGRQLFLGTTAARLLRHLPIPMVVVPRPDPASQDPSSTDPGVSSGIVGE
ncbi:universal stress protein [Kocuria sp.]|uniref:universal stress protein n=1 Tax=Kocuria sp. TaxID=1871328 RepID=UPI0026E08CCD|nr:universal stress protein [Kocuria sp.]MDO5618212.1 universal stress protein [Kocuria sp.]